MNCAFKVAVVVPVYNCADYIGECLESLSVQIYNNFEVYVIDDGSSDGSYEVVTEFAKRDGRFIVMRQENKGIGVARNVGLNEMGKRGGVDYVCFVDSDDKIKPDFLDVLIEKAINYKSDVTICGFENFDRYGVVNNADLCIADQRLGKDDFVDLILSQRRFKNVNGRGGMVWKQLYSYDLVRDVRFLEERNVIEDEHYLMQVALRSKNILYIGQTLYQYRKREGSAITDIDYKEKLYRGRILCIPLASKISETSKLTLLGILVRHFIRKYKKTGKVSHFLYEWMPLYEEMYKNNCINAVELMHLFFIVKIPLMANCFYRIRKVFH